MPVIKSRQMEENVIKVQSVSKAKAKVNRERNKYIKKYGDSAWAAAVLTAYQCGGYKEFKYNYEKVPLKYMNLLLDAYKFKNTELELSIAQAAARPYMKKNDSIKYIESLSNKLEGNA